MERSAEWLRGRISALMDGNVYPSTREAQLDRYRALLAEAEAREGSNQTTDERIDSALETIYLRYGPNLAQFFEDVKKMEASEASVPTAAECELSGYHLDQEVEAGTLTLSETIQGLREACAGVKVSKREEPTAEEVIEACRVALGGIEWFLDSGVQESSLAPRCCSVCGRVQVGGKPEHGNNCNAVDIKAALTLIAKYKEAHGG